MNLFSLHHLTYASLYKVVYRMKPFPRSLLFGKTFRAVPLKVKLCIKTFALAPVHEDSYLILKDLALYIVYGNTVLVNC